MSECKRLGIYLHIPFCRSKCDYCDFYSIAGAQPALMDRFQKAMLAHLEEAAPLADRYVVNSVYFGGGTPSFYGEKRIRGLLKAVNRLFHLSRDCEITMEANPDSVTRPMLTHLRRAGINRLSLGVQSACDRQLAQLHRPHTFQQAVQAVQAARQAGLDNLSLDLIYGLPGQTMAQWQDTVEQVLALEPRHLSCYGLKVEEGTPLFLRRESACLPDDDAQADQYLWTVERLARAGYEQYEISNFAQPGYPSRHNLKYWLGEEYIGFGPAAHSDFGGRRYSYVRDLEAYLRGVLENGTVVDESELIPQAERAGEYLMLRLRTARGIEESEYRRAFRMNFQPLEEQLCLYEQQGWAARQDGRWRLTPEGFLRSNQLIVQLLELQEAAVLQSVQEHREQPCSFPIKSEKI